MNMKTKVMSTILAAIMLTMTACGTISPPIQNAVTETTTTITETIHDSADSSEDEKIKTVLDKIDLPLKKPTVPTVFRKYLLKARTAVVF